MKILVFDTETTGLYSKKEKDIDKQPYIVQFAGIVVDMEDDGTYKELSRIDQLIKPPMSIPYETSKIHHIYDGDVMDKGNFEDYAKIISYYINEPDIIVAHNLEFDKNILKVEFKRLLLKGLPYDYAPKKEICTMNSSINYCRLPKKSIKAKGFKRPKLQELTKKTIGNYFLGAHNAMVDVEYTLKAFSILVKEGVIKLEKNNMMSLF